MQKKIYWTLLYLGLFLAGTIHGYLPILFPSEYIYIYDLANLSSKQIEIPETSIANIFEISSTNKPRVTIQKPKNFESLVANLISFQTGHIIITDNDTFDSLYQQGLVKSISNYDELTKKFIYKDFIYSNKKYFIQLTWSQQQNAKGLCIGVPENTPDENISKKLIEKLLEQKQYQLVLNDVTSSTLTRSNFDTNISRNKRADFYRNK